MSWELLCEENGKAASEVSAAVDTVRQQIMTGGTGQSGPAILSVKVVEIECTRKFVAASEKELRSLTGLTRMAKAVMKGIPTVQVPGEQGGSETLYIFKHPSALADFRELKVHVKMEAQMSQEMMQKDSVFWKNQAEMMFDDVASSSSMSSGVGALLSKDVKVIELDAWKEQRFKETAPEGPLAGSTGDADAAINVSDDEGSVVGIAATEAKLERAGSSAGLDRGVHTPASKTKKPKPEQKSSEPGSVSKDSIGDAAASSCPSTAPASKGLPPLPTKEMSVRNLWCHTVVRLPRLV